MTRDTLGRLSSYSKIGLREKLYERKTGEDTSFYRVGILLSYIDNGIAGTLRCAVWCGCPCIFKTLGALFSPSLTPREIANLKRPSMALCLYWRNVGVGCA